MKKVESPLIELIKRKSMLEERIKDLEHIPGLKAEEESAKLQEELKTVEKNIKARQFSSVSSMPRFQSEIPILKTTVDKPKKVSDQFYELDVPNDHSCFFWAIAFCYLLPVIDNDGPDFQIRYIKLFGNVDHMGAFQAELKKYNPYSFNTLDKFENLGDFIQRGCRFHIAEAIQTFEAHIDYNSAVDHGNSLEEYIDYMKDPGSWAGDIEFEVVSRMLELNIVRYSDDTVQSFPCNYPYDAAETLQIVAVNAIGGESKDKNHFHFYLSSELVESYKVKAQSAEKASYQPPHSGMMRRLSPLSIDVGGLERPLREADQRGGLVDLKQKRLNWNDVQSGLDIVRIFQDQDYRRIHEGKVEEICNIIVRKATDLHTRSTDISHFALLASCSSSLGSSVFSQFTTQLCKDGLQPADGIKLLSGLSNALQLALVNRVGQDGLINLYRIQFKILTDLHKKNPDAGNILVALKGISLVTDAMVDSRIVDLSKDEIADPSYNVLEDLKKHPNPEVQYLARYSQQGLLRISTTEPLYKFVLRKIGYTLDIVGDLGTIAARLASAVLSGGASFAWLTTIPKNFINVYKNGKKLFGEKFIKAEEWYDQVRMFQLAYDLITGVKKAEEFPLDTGNSQLSVKNVEGSDDFYRGYVYTLEKIYDSGEDQRALLESPEVMQKTRDLFNVLIKRVNDAWIAGRLIRLIKLSIDDAGLITPEDVQQFKPKLKSGFDQLDKPSRSLVEFQKFIRYGLIVALLETERDVLSQTLNLISDIYKHLGNQYLHQRLERYQWVGFDKDVRTIRIEVINALRFLLIYGSPNVRDQAIEGIKDIIDSLEKTIEIQSRSSSPFAKEFRKALDLLKSYQLHAFDQMPTLDLAPKRSVLGETFELLRAAKSEYAVAFLDLSFFCDRLLGQKQEEVGRHESHILRQGRGDFNELDLYTPVNARVYKTLDIDGKDVIDIVKAFLDSRSGPTSLVLLGNTGSGKSMFCRYYARALASFFEGAVFSKDSYLPVFIHLPHFIRFQFKSGDQRDYIDEYLIFEFQRMFNVDFSLDHLKELQENYKVVFFLDSYDEINRTPNLSDFFQKWKNVKVVVTCRTQWIREMGRDFSGFFSLDGSSNSVHMYEILPFTKISAYVNNYLSVMGDVIVEDFTEPQDQEKWTSPETYISLISGENKISGLADLVTTPFFLRISIDNMNDLAEQFQKTGEAIKLFDLYDIFVLKFHKRQISKNGTDQDIQKLRIRGAWIDLMEKVCGDIAVDIDRELRQKELPPVIVYDRSWNEAPWNKYWKPDPGTTDAELILAEALLRAVPLRESETALVDQKDDSHNTRNAFAFEFLHNTLLSYFLVKRGLLPMERFDDREIAMRAARLDRSHQQESLEPSQSVDQKSEDDSEDSENGLYDPSYIKSLGRT